MSLDYAPVESGAKYDYFQTGTVVSVNQQSATCTIIRTEGGMLYDIPILNTTGGGINSTDSSWISSLRGNNVVMIPIHGVLYVLATVPTFATPPKSVI